MNKRTVTRLKTWALMVWVFLAVIPQGSGAVKPEIPVDVLGRLILQDGGRKNLLIPMRGEPGQADRTG